MNLQRLFVVVFLLSLVSTQIQAADKSSKAKADSVKTGWNFGALPAISFDTDLGLQYGDGKRFPKYNLATQDRGFAF